jgi:hypothetical protein
MLETRNLKCVYAFRRRVPCKNVEFGLAGRYFREVTFFGGGSVVAENSSGD